jgi:hypothetical protein
MFELVDIDQGMHFEDIWNDAERIASKYPEEVNTREKIVARLQSAIDLLGRNDSMTDTINRQELILGNILYDLASYCEMMDRTKHLQINSAKAMRQVTDDKKQRLFDSSDLLDQLHKSA